MKKLLLSIFLLYPVLTFADIVMNPYLMNVDTNCVYVVVECTTGDTAYVNFGLTPSFGFTAKTGKKDTTDISPTTFVHIIKLSGLSANTQYYYRVTHGSSTSTTATFKTAVRYGTNFKFVFMADSRRPGHPYHDQICTQILTHNPLFLIHGGDVCYTPLYTDWKEDFFRTNQLNVMDHIPLFFSAGNHEAWLQNTLAFTQDSRFSGTHGYYSFDYGFIHFLILNNEVNCDSGSAQYNFAYNDLASTNKPWKIAVFHKPAYCGGGEGDNVHMKNFSKNIFVPLHLDLVLCGHSHFYQHNLVSGLHHFIIGSAGAELQTPVDSAFTVKSVMDYNFGLFDVSQTDLVLRVYNNVNTMIDSVRFYKGVGVENNIEKLSGFLLCDNFPNPFNSSTVIRFSISENANRFSDNGIVSLKVYDILGKELSVLLNEKLSPGDYSVKWNGADYPSGIYFYKLTCDNFSDTKRMVIIK